MSTAEVGERAMEEELAGLQPDLSAIERQLEERDKCIRDCQQRCASHTMSICHFPHHLMSGIKKQAGNARRLRKP